jgi:hypothetical protein
VAFDPVAIMELIGDAFRDSDLATTQEDNRSKDAHRLIFKLHRFLGISFSP